MVNANINIPSTQSECNNDWMAVDEEWPKIETNIQYSEESSLNTLNICLPRAPSSEDANRLWIVFIHGGAWQDPDISAFSFDKTQGKLLASSINNRVAGYASINYRLSPYPSHPTNPSNPSDPARTAKHPDHINDVLSAILYLQEKYHFEDRYILVGHSAGATLALQVAMKRYWGSQYESTFALELNVVPPVAIIGMEGIYDIPDLVAENPDYKDFIANAFGKSGWDAVSPTNADFDDSWPDGKLVVLAQSYGDTLIGWRQAELQKRALESKGWKESGERKVKTFELHGDHDEVWETGDAARAIEYAVQELSDTT